MPVIELAACQAHVTLEDYTSEEQFHRMLDRIARRLSAQRARSPSGAYAHPCLAAFPEMIGAFLPIAGRASLIRHAPTTDLALALIAARTLPSLVRAMLRGGTRSTKVGFLLAASPEVRRIYRDAFSRFARENECWVVAGSALLPKNAHGDFNDQFEPAGGQIYNTSYAFDPEGRHVGCVRKVNLVPTLEDRLGLSPGSPGDLHPFPTSFGPVGTLICYDGFYIPHTRSEPGFRRLAARYDAQGCAVLAQPAANPWPWEAPWVFAEPGETQLRREQWYTEGLLGQLGAGHFTNLRYAVVPQLIGAVIDNHFDGRSHILERDAAGGARLIGEAASHGPGAQAEEVILRAVEV
jgi:predicted amidohydrolase